MLWGIKIYWKIIKTMKKLLPIMSNWQTYYHFKVDFQEVNQQGNTTTNYSKSILDHYHD